MKTRVLFFCILSILHVSYAGPRTSANYNILTDALDYGGVTESSANYLNTGSAGLINGIAGAASGGGVNKSGYVAQLVFGGSLVPISAVSRKIHGPAGEFLVNLPLTGTPGIECRSGGSNREYEVVITFASAVTVTGDPQAAVTTGIGCVGTGNPNPCPMHGTVSVSGPVVTVPLTLVGNAQTIVITLFNVSDGTNTGNVTIPVSVLIGDTSGNGRVNSSDVSLTKSKSGQTVGASNFREDVTVNGSINSSDVSLVKSKSGTALP